MLLLNTVLSSLLGDTFLCIWILILGIPMKNVKQYNASHSKIEETEFRELCEVNGIVVWALRPACLYHILLQIVPGAHKTSI